ncbi:hypothetical protein AOQ84DRAFT_437948 [Glonium stellatum]|uniref:Uncharacterized protein n=1 Tax=Glonium stellatum TaxID=574774 RepID=A0A8E2JVT7_9PEZI|nr:hypothetical protein AOQ84DRAFT_437948 [Glonium stellatum]
MFKVSDYLLVACLEKMFRTMNISPFPHHPAPSATKCGHLLHPSASLNTPYCPLCLLHIASEKFAAAKARLELEGGPWPDPMIRDLAWNKARLALEIARKALLNQTQRNAFRNEREAHWDRIHKAWEGIRDFNLLALSNAEVLDAVVNKPNCFACASMRNMLTEGSGLPSRQIYNFKIDQYEGMQWMAWYAVTAWWDQAKAVIRTRKRLQCKPKLQEGVGSAKHPKKDPATSDLREVQKSRAVDLDILKGSKPAPSPDRTKTHTIKKSQGSQLIRDLKKEGRRLLRQKAQKEYFFKLEGVVRLRHDIPKEVELDEAALKEPLAFVNAPSPMKALMGKRAKNMTRMNWLIKADHPGSPLKDFQSIEDIEYFGDQVGNDQGGLSDLERLGDSEDAKRALKYIDFLYFVG